MRNTWVGGLGRNIHACSLQNKYDLTRIIRLVCAEGGGPVLETFRNLFGVRLVGYPGLMVLNASVQEAS